MIEVQANAVSVKGTQKRPIVLFGAWHKDVNVLKTPEDLAEWERRVQGILGPETSAKAVLAGGGTCCGSEGGMCDAD